MSMYGNGKKSSSDEWNEHVHQRMLIMTEELRSLGFTAVAILGAGVIDFSDETQICETPAMLDINHEDTKEEALGGIIINAWAEYFNAKYGFDISIALRENIGAESLDDQAH